MTTNTATGSGFYDEAAKWSEGHAPIIGEGAVIPTGIVMETRSANTCLGSNLYIAGGGTLKLGAGITHNVDQYLTVASGGALISLGTVDSIVIIEGSKSSFAHWELYATSVSKDTVLSYLHLKDNYWTFGSFNTNFLFFNDPAGSVTTAWINSVKPLSRSPIIVHHRIDGRKRGRIYQTGSDAGVVRVSGYFLRSSMYEQKLQDIQAANVPLALITDRVHIARCRITGEITYNPSPGQLIIPFSMSLIEDY